MITTLPRITGPELLPITYSYSAANANYALDLARTEAERIHGPLKKRPFLVTDNGPTFIAKKFDWVYLALNWVWIGFVFGAAGRLVFFVIPYCNRGCVHLSIR